MSSEIRLSSFSISLFSSDTICLPLCEIIVFTGDFLHGQSLLAPADLETAPLPYQHLPVEKQFAQLGQRLAERFIHNRLVMVLHCLFGYHRGVLDTLCVLRPNVVTLSVKDVAQGLAVVPHVLAAEEPR